MDWLHEIKYDGYRMRARIDGSQVKLLTRTGLDWSHRYRRTMSAWLPAVKSAYLDGELCALNADGVPIFSRLQAAMDGGRTDSLSSSPSTDTATFQRVRQTKFNCRLQIATVRLGLTFTWWQFRCEPGRWRLR